MVAFGLTSLEERMFMARLARALDEVARTRRERAEEEEKPGPKKDGDPRNSLASFHRWRAR
jgi:hypothetical protein